MKEEDFNQSTYLGSFRKVRNAYPLMTNKGVYENQRASSSNKRVFILTRSAFAGQQRYATTAWSGDIDSRWDVFRKQIPAGLNFSLCGIPYWNTDIGGFFSHKMYRDGVKDDGFKELYVRWMQFGTFSPMMRSHGTDTPREIYQFGDRGDWAFDAQEEMINLRYRLLPYIYSTSWQVTSTGGSFIRALFMDFPEDSSVHDMDNEYLFGKSILVNPVTESLYLNETGEISFDKVKSQKVYLPKGSQWIDFWTGRKYDGGKHINKEVPINILPLYIKAGSIIALGPKVQYANEKEWDNLEIRIYPGSNGEFTLYEDENDGYNYEKGIYSEIKFKWDDENQTLYIGQRKGIFPNMLKQRKFQIVLVSKDNGIGISSKEVKSNIITYDGNSIEVKL